MHSVATGSTPSHLIKLVPDPKPLAVLTTTNLNNLTIRCQYGVNTVPYHTLSLYTPSPYTPSPCTQLTVQHAVDRVGLEVHALEQGSGRQEPEYYINY